MQLYLLGLLTIVLLLVIAVIYFMYRRMNHISILVNQLLNDMTSLQNHMDVMTQNHPTFINPANLFSPIMQSTNQSHFHNPIPIPLNSNNQYEEQTDEDSDEDSETESSSTEETESISDISSNEDGPEVTIENIQKETNQVEVEETRLDNVNRIIEEEMKRAEDLKKKKREVTVDLDTDTDTDINVQENIKPITITNSNNIINIVENHDEIEPGIDEKIISIDVTSTGNDRKRQHKKKVGPPEESPADFEVGHRKQTSDDKWYEIIVLKNGNKKWKAVD